MQDEGDKGVVRDREGEANPSRRTRLLTSRELFDHASEVDIEHAGVVYRLRITKQGKLILNK